MNVIHVDFTPSFRSLVAKHIKHYGVSRANQALLGEGCHQSFVTALIRSIMGREGW